MSEQYEAQRQYDRPPGMIAGAAAGGSIGADNGATAQPALERVREQVVGLTKHLAGLNADLAAYLHARLGPPQLNEPNKDGDRAGRAKPIGIVNDVLAMLQVAREEAHRVQAQLHRLQQL